MGRDSSDSIVTRYELDGPGIESRGGGKIFHTCPNLPWGLRNLLHNGCRVSSLEVQRPVLGVDYPPLLAPMSKKE